MASPLDRQAGGDPCIDAAVERTDIFESGVTETRNFRRGVLVRAIAVHDDVAL